MFKLTCSVHCLAETAEQILKAIFTCSLMFNNNYYFLYVHVNDHSIQLAHFSSLNMNDKLAETWKPTKIPLH